MKIKRTLMGVLAGLLVLGTCLPGMALAKTPAHNTQSWTEAGQTVAFSTPASYESCPSGLGHDRLWTTGIPRTWRLLGRVTVEYVIRSGHQLVRHYTIDQHGDLDLTLV